jgi:hypothetical protein
MQTVGLPYWIIKEEKIFETKNCYQNEIFRLYIFIRNS